ncbi:MAG: protein phosphatase CheZ [Alphaproteobacteria bacterium]|nr:protein phosphatase CheZ [Alphaproteobacteria bacterium]
MKKELLGLFQYIQRVRQEIAAIWHPAEDEHRFNSIAEQLDAVVKATEKASDTIMGAMENNDTLVMEIKKMVKDPTVNQKLDKISENGAAVFEACSFQDITGQRINKVAKSLTYVEKHVNRLIEAWGKDAVQKTEVKPDKVKTSDEDLLHGPQLEGKGVSQDEIDKLFQ